MITVLIADDHGVLRDGLAALIDEQPDMSVVATAETGEEAVARCRAARADVAVIDLTMPSGGGLHALRELSSCCPSTRALVLTMHDDAESLRACLAAGAAGYLAKHVAAGELVRAIRDVASGRSAIRVGLQADALRRAVEAPEPRPELSPDGLSPREREVLELLALGHTSKEIGAELGLSPKSVDSYRERIYQKLGIRGRAELVRYALRHGVLTPR